ncbi:indoleamine 2,3-dioxygenase 1 [Betta splendens]|uniref:Indoleamine 2,3-dioxygenase 1 n=1 Tax=Betta splendens TaxID=158456 RepID=A0A6P7NJH5_BETSP|nr:indoleamine 2,3-dioxygenase 1 [Betta splendens]
MAAAKTHCGASFSLDAYHVSEEFGFILPDPLDELPPYYQPWMDVALRIPELVHARELRARVNKMPLLSSEFLQKHRELRLAHLALSMVTMGYVWQEGEGGTVEMLPCNLAVPYWEVSQRLGLPPILTHADGVLANWRKKDPEGPFNMENLELLVRLPGGDSVQGFFLVTLLVELAGAPAVASIPRVIDGVQRGDAEAVARALEDISQSIQDMTDALKMMQVYVEPSVFYGIMRIYLSGWKDNPCMPRGLIYEGVHAEPLQYSGGSAAQSSLLHCFDELLGIRHETQNGDFLSRMRNYMPPAHKRLIQDLSAQPPLQEFARRQADGQLNRALQLCAAKLLAFRSYHINVVGRFISVPAARARQLRQQRRGAGEDAVSRAPAALEERGTGGSGVMTFLKSVRDQTKQAFLPEAGKDVE